jgi:cytochrome c2
LASRLALLIVVVLLAGGCVRPPPVAGGRTGCGSCHAPHHLREGTCQDCHRGDPGAEREELAHARLVAGRAAEHGLPGGLAPREGRRLVARLACRRCHVIGGEGNRLAADLDRVVWSREQGQLVASLLEPVDFMPAFGLDQAQAEAIVAYLLRRASREGGQDAYRVHFERHAEAGGSAFETHCGGCHRVITAAGPGGTGSDGPNLSGLFTRFYPPTAPGDRPWTEKALAEWLRNPRAARAHTTMGPVRVDEAELARLVGEMGGTAAPAPR